MKRPQDRSTLLRFASGVSLQSRQGRRPESRAESAAARSQTWLAALLIAAASAACGKKGPPLPPLHLVPQAVTDVSVRRSGDEVRLRFTLPVKNANGPDPVNLGRVEIYAATIAPGAVAPPNRELLTSKFVVGRVDVEPRAAEGEPAKPDDPRPSPGEMATFVEELTEEIRRPQFTELPPPVATPADAPAPSAAAPSTVMRIYAIRGMARNGRPGQPSARIEVPLVPPPAAPAGVAADFTAEAIELTWKPPSAEGAGQALFNVYAAGADVPLHPSPLAEPRFERSGISFGKEECFVVRSVAQFGVVAIESEPSAEACVTPTDIFPPAAPKALSAVAGGGAINLIWGGVPDADLAGYIVLRGEAPGETLQAVTPTPIRETTYRDTTVVPGVRYVYAVVAVDKATPPNTSSQSPRVEETAR